MKAMQDSLGRMGRIMNEHHMYPSKMQLFELFNTIRDFYEKDTPFEELPPKTEFHIVKRPKFIDGYSIGEHGCLFLIRETENHFDYTYRVEPMSRKKWLEYENMGPNINHGYNNPYISTKIQLSISNRSLNVLLDDHLSDNLETANKFFPTLDERVYESMRMWAINNFTAKDVENEINKGINSDLVLRNLINLLIFEQFVECNLDRVVYL